MTKKNYIMSLLVASIILGAGVFGYVKHQQSVKVDTSITAIIVANSVTANFMDLPGKDCYNAIVASDTSADVVLFCGGCKYLDYANGSGPVSNCK